MHITAVLTDRAAAPVSPAVVIGGVVLLGAAAFAASTSSGDESAESAAPAAASAAPAAAAPAVSLYLPFKLWHRLCAVETFPDAFLEAISSHSVVLFLFVLDLY